MARGCSQTQMVMGQLMPTLRVRALARARDAIGLDHELITTMNL